MAKLALIVDDNRALAEDLAELLESEGYSIRVFNDPLVALREADKLAFDVALLDVRMPGMSGVTLQAHLMAQRPDARFVLMTAYADDKLIKQGLDAGASAVLTKPVPIDRLFASLGDERSRELLLVEDDAAFRETLVEALSENGYRCLGVGTADEARKLLSAASEQGRTFATGIIDMRLPDASGAALAKEFSAAALPCILITGWDPHLIDAQHEPAPPILVKPFAFHVLLTALRQTRDPA
jgi:DNA-binding NtrC family response regulator